MEIRGIYLHTIYRNEATGLTRFTLITDACKEHRNSRGVLVCRGIMPVFASGMPIKLEGEIVQAILGAEFKFSSISPFSDRSQVTINYLSSGVFDGIGVKTAEKIVAITGPDIFSFIQKPNAKEILTEEIGSAKIESLFQTLRNTFQTKVVMDYIQQYGGDYTHAANITQQHPANSIEALKNNCYKIGMEAGLSFFVCDSIAQHEKYFAFDERRIAALIQVAFSRITSRGHTCADIESLYKEVQNVAKSSAFTDAIPKGLIVRTVNKDKTFAIDASSEIRYYLSDMYRAERDLAREALRIQGCPIALPYSDTIIAEIESTTNIEYSAKQKNAFSFLKTTGIKILTGGPGTGKTTAINGLIKAYRVLNPNGKILLCAPTGRAAQKMYEATGIRAQTIHRAIDVRPFGNEIQYKTLEDPLEQDFIIVDEMSMADITIISMLLGAVKTNSTVVLCGDINQLPSVGPGAVLHDLIASHRFETVTLDVIYRQAKGSSIISNAISINEGTLSLTYDSHFKVITVDNEEQIRDNVKALMQKKYDYRNVFSAQVLSSTKKGPAGTTELNLALQDVCNPQKFSSSENTVMQYGQYKYTVGDKIMMTANNYKVGYFNGDIGTIKAINSMSVTVDINNTAIEISKKNLADMSLALATTIHKSQGSEFSTVIVALPLNPSVMLQRNLLYTAVTRAKMDIVIVAEKGAIEQAVKTISNTNRNTRLLERINLREPDGSSRKTLRAHVV